VNSDNEGTDGNTGPWSKFKKIVYDGVDSMSSIIVDDEDAEFNNVQKGQISQGYDSSLERSVSSRFGNIPMSPAERILMKEQLSSGIRQSSGVTSVQQQQREQRQEREQRSSFDNFKAGVYGVVDFVTGPAPSRPKKKDQEEARNTNEDAPEQPYTLAVPSKPSFNQIREQEARARAQIRNEKIRAKKDILYKYVDKLQESVDALPETFDSAEESVKEAIEFSKTIPAKIEKTVNQIQAIPEKIEEKASATQKSIKESVQKTQQVAKDVQNIPSKVNLAIANAQESVQEAVTNVKVLVGVEKPRPKPPKKPPPPRKKPKEIALDLAGKAASATASLAWKGTKAASSLAWKGAKVAYVKSMESIGPAVEDALKQRQQDALDRNTTVSSIRMSPKPPSTPPPVAEPTEPSAVASKEQKNVKSIETPEQLAKKVAEAQALAREVEEALEMAERALQISAMDKIPKDKNDKNRKK
jgi:hypothetical protein